VRCVSFSLPGQAVTIVGLRYTCRLLAAPGDAVAEYTLTYDIPLPLGGYPPGINEVNFIGFTEEFAKFLGTRADANYAGTVQVVREFIGGDGVGYGRTVLGPWNPAVLIS
jgi:hypothetical protein